MTAKWVEGRVAGRRRWTERLFSLRVDAPVDPFRAGQFTRVALDVGEQRVARPYSYVNAPDERPLEFYYITVSGGPLTARLPLLEPGEPVWVAPKPSGMLTLAEVTDAEQLWLLSTGTAIGPFLSILKTPEPWQRFNRVVLVHAVRIAAELAYRELIEGIAGCRGGQFAYIPFVSREDAGYAIRGRVPEALRDGRLEARAGLAISARTSRVLVCGNPAMVEDTLAVLEARGLKRNKRKESGQISVETYW
ncbi:MAG TPA: ferredoxin--NADP reductase [Burkholderiales bacterium]|nr:ferredoxin--NADP reductase [Burkholderiales bacterium]